VLELHFPGSAPVVKVLGRILHEAGLRQAEPGEFTRRAFLNGNIDLAQAEAVLDLVHSSTARQAQAAAKVLGGSLGNELRSARDALASALVQLEAGLDFEEGDSADLTPGEVTSTLEVAATALIRGEESEKQRAVEQGTFWRIALIGPTNAGKSSLFRALTGKRTLISDVAGTTRDRLQAEWPVGDLIETASTDAIRPWLLCDLPGLGGEAVDDRDTAARVRASLDTFDFQWLVVDASASPTTLPIPLADIPARVVITKADLPHQISGMLLSEASQWGIPLWVSSASALGFQELASATLGDYLNHERQHASAMRSVDRHRQAFSQALQAVRRAQSSLEIDGTRDLVAEEIRAGLMALAELAGEFTPEALLDQLFGDFCIGK
jgi:tRNA modification GTPase